MLAHIMAAFIPWAEHGAAPEAPRIALLWRGSLSGGVGRSAPELRRGKGQTRRNPMSLWPVEG